MVIVTHGKRLYCIHGIVNETGAGSHLLSVNKTTINEGQSGRREKKSEKWRSRRDWRNNEKAALIRCYNTVEPHFDYIYPLYDLYL